VSDFIQSLGIGYQRTWITTSLSGAVPLLFTLTDLYLIIFNPDNDLSFVRLSKTIRFHLFFTKLWWGDTDDPGAALVSRDGRQPECQWVRQLD